MDENDDTEAFIYVADDQHDVDFSQYIYETALLQLPIRRVCPEGTATCVIGGVAEDQGEPDAPVDPRWAALKNIKI
jgi:uncharacterized metal-binding protein YceD (DUF177 family)